MRVIYVFILLMFWVSPTYAETLTLDEAVSLAGQKDPMLEQTLSKARALDEKSVSDGQLADPKVTLGLDNYPTGGEGFTNENMTKVSLGVQQAFPRGRSLTYKSRKTEAMADIERARYEDQQRQITLAVQQSWLSLYYWQQAAKTVDESEALLKKVIEASESAYGTGRQNIQDIIGAELELSVLEDKRVDINRQLETAQAELGKWIGAPAAKRAVSETFPVLTSLRSYEDIQNDLTQHPKIKAADAMVEAGNHGVKIAGEQYKPGFNVGLKYGYRGGNYNNGAARPDNVSAMVTLDVPLFTEKRQDKQVSASKFEAASATFMRDDALRNLGTMLDREHANWSRLGERVKHYETDVIKRAEDNFEASLRAYQEDLTDFSSLMRAQVMELNTKLDWMKLKTDQAKAQARLLYLQGDK